MPTPEIAPNDEILRAQDLAVNMKRSVRFVQKLFELGEIQTFKMGRESVTLRSQYHAYLRRLIAEEEKRLEERDG